MPGPYIDTKSSLLLVKKFTYRGSDKLWSNRYHFTGPLAMDTTKFNTFADAVAADEKELYTAGVTIVRATWNDATSATTTNPHGLATFDKVMSVAGVLSVTSARISPGDAAAVLRFSTTQRNVDNKPIYLYKYYHQVFSDAGASQDDIIGTQITAYNEFGDDALAGWSDGTDTRILCSPRGAVAQARTLLAHVRHRDFPT